MKNLQKYLLFLYVFSIYFEGWDPFNTEIDFFFTKVTVMLYLMVSIFNLKSISTIRYYKRFLYPIVFFFLLLTFMSYSNSSSAHSTFFNVPFFLSIMVMIFALNQERKEPQLLLKCLFVFSISSIVLTILYFGGIGLTYTLDNRVSVFKNNQNDLGINLAISIFLFISIIFENKLNFGKKRNLLYFFFPFLLLFLVGTGSRVAFVSLLLGVVVFFLFNKSKIKGTKLFFILLLFILLFFIWELYVKSTFIAERLFSSINDGDLSGRDVLWANNIELILKNPFFGSGETGYAHSFDNILEDWGSPHNVILEVLCYTGIVGLTIFMIFITRIVVCCVKSYLNNKLILPIILIIPIFGLLLSGQIFETKISWIVFAYIISGYVKNRKLKFQKL